MSISELVRSLARHCERQVEGQHMLAISDIALLSSVRTYSKEIKPNKERRCPPLTVMTCAPKRLLRIIRGERKTDVSKMFKISRNTLNLWLKRKQETGNCRAVTNYQQGCRHKITDWERFEAFIEQHGGKTQAQLASLWGDKATQQNISAAIQKLGISRKKRPTVIENAMSASAVSSKTN